MATKVHHQNRNRIMIGRPLKRWRRLYSNIGHLVRKNIPYLNFKLITRLEMLPANDIVPRNSELPGLDTPPAREMSSGKGEYSRVKKGVESGQETDSESDENSKREKALLVCF